MFIYQNKQVRSRKIKGKWILLGIDKQHLQELNTIAGTIWEMAEVSVSIDSIIKKIASSTGESEKSVRKDVQEFVEQCLKERLLLTTTQSG